MFRFRLIYDFNVHFDIVIGVHSVGRYYLDVMPNNLYYIKICKVNQSFD